MIGQFDDLPQPTHSDNEENEDDILAIGGHHGIPPVCEDDEEGEISGDFGQQQQQQQQQHQQQHEHIQSNTFKRKQQMFLGKKDKFNRKYIHEEAKNMNEDIDEYDVEFEEGETDGKNQLNLPAQTVIQQQRKFPPQQSQQQQQQHQQQQQQQNPHKRKKLEGNNSYANKHLENTSGKQFSNFRKEYPDSKKDNFKQINKLKTSSSLVEDLTFEEAERLLEAWRQSSFIQFNNWVQVSKCSLRQEFTAHQSGVDEKGEKSSQITGFSCNLTLTFYKFRHGNIHDFVAVGFGKRKQDAKKMALERLVVDLIQTGSIKFGLRDKKFTVEDSAPQVKENVYFQQIVKPKPRSDFEEKLQESNLKRARKIAKKLQECLKKQNIAEAVNCLREISKFKQLEWNEISFIWSYGVVKQNSVLLQQVLDVINKKPVGIEGALQPAQNASKMGDDVIQSSKDFLNKYDEDKVKQKLFLHYGITRQKSTNIHDIYDSTAIEFAEKEILTSGLPPFNEEEFGRELIRDPFARDLQDILIPITNAETVAAGSASPLRTVYEKAQKWPMRYVARPLGADEKEEDLEGEDDLSIAKLHPKLKFLKDFDVNSSNYQKVSQAIFGKSATSLAKGAGDQESVTAFLLDEMYETLLYSGDKQFSLEIAEKMYSQLLIQPFGFIHESSAEYYAHCKNLLITELIDDVYQTIWNRNPVEYACSVNGKIEKIGTAHNYDVIALTALETEEVMESKLIKRCKFDVTDTQDMIVEGDIVILTTFFRPSYDKPVLTGEQSKLCTAINARARGTADNRDFVHTITEFGNVIEYAIIATVRELTKDNKLKLFINQTLNAVIKTTTTTTTTTNTTNGTIEQLSSNADTIKTLDSVESGRHWKVTKIFSRTTHDRMQEALRSICFDLKAAHPAILHTLCTPISKSSPIIRKLAAGEKYKVSSTKTQLNGEQQLAVEKAAVNRITLIQGPTGSGKTTTAIEIVLEWLRQSNQPILLTSLTQLSVNNLYTELIKAGVRAVLLSHGFEDTINSLNSNNSYKADPQFDFPFKLSSSHNPTISQSIPSSMKFLLLKKMLREASVVCCTCSSVMSDYLKGLHFTRVIIDDATQVSEPLALIPLHKLCNQLVLLGDQMMSSPKSNSVFAQSKGMCLSLYEKLISQGFNPHLLKCQYRISGNQTMFQSRYFYNGMLENNVPEDYRSELRGFPWPNPAIKTCLILVKGQEQATQLQDQLQNIKEVEVVVEILIQLLKPGYIRQNDVGILTTFQEQKRRIRTEIAVQAKKNPQMWGLSIEETIRLTKHSSLVDIETIDTIDSLDKDLVIFSPVRTNKHKALGVLRDPRILNSILWNAKRGLIIVGDMDTLSCDPHWREYLKWARSNNLVLCFCK